MACSSNSCLKYEIKLSFKGSLLVTWANEPLKLCTIREVPLSNLFSSGSSAKSLSASSLVVIIAIVTPDR